MTPKPKRQLPSNEPRTAKGFKALWNSPDTEALIKGDTHFPDRYVRQLSFVGHIINAGLILHTYEKLKQKDKVVSLRFFFPNPEELTAKEIATLEGPSDEARLALLVSMSKEDVTPKRLKSYRDLISNDKWAIYKRKVENYLAAVNRDPALENKDDFTPVTPDNLVPVKPVDPRIQEVNDHILSTIQIDNPGPKTEKAIYKTMVNKLYTTAAELSDINRIGILPTKAEYAKDFIKVIEALNPPVEKRITGYYGEYDDKKKAEQKALPHKILSRIFAEPSEILSNGYFNQKVIVAWDGDKNNTNVTRDNSAIRMEVKISPANMDRVQHLSAATKAVSKELMKPAYYTSAFVNPDKPVESRPTIPELLRRRNTLKTAYDKAKGDFESVIKSKLSETLKEKGQYYLLPQDFDAMPLKDLHKGNLGVMLKEIGLTYKFPDYVEDKDVNRKGAYEKLARDLLECAEKIHLDAMLKEDKSWCEEFVRTALIQKLWLEKDKDNRYRNNMLKVYEKEPTAKTVNQNLIDAIAKYHAIDVKALEGKIKAEVTAAARS